MENEIIEIFNQYAVQIEGEAQLYATRAEARAALSIHNNSETIEARIEAYCTDSDIDGKVAVGQGNIIRKFLTFEASLEEETELQEAA